VRSINNNNNNNNNNNAFLERHSAVASEWVCRIWYHSWQMSLLFCNIC